MREASELSPKELLDIVDTIQQFLYLDAEFWNPEKQWNGADVCGLIASLLDKHDMVPNSTDTSDD